MASVHGREFDYIKNINDEDIAGLVLLTDDIQNPYEITKKLYDNGIRNLTIIVGENLSYDNEKITILLSLISLIMVVICLLHIKLMD